MTLFTNNTYHSKLHLMKRYAIYGLLCLLGFFSCQPDDQELAIQPIDPGDIPTTEAVAVDNEWYYAGYGFNPALQKPYRLSIADEAITSQSSDVGIAFEPEISIIDSYEKYEEFLRKERRRGGGINVFFVSFGGSKGSSLTKKKLVDRGYFSVVVRITSKITRSFVRGATLIPEAQALIDAGEIQRFYDTYGTEFVYDHIVGGDVYYVYRVNREKLIELTERGSSGSVRAGFQYIVGLQVEGSGEKVESSFSEISEAVTDAGQVSNVIGYPAQTIRSIEDYDREITSLQAYLRENLPNAGTIEMELKPYADLFPDNEALRTEAERRKDCYTNYEQWEDVENRLSFVYENLDEGGTRESVAQALSEVAAGKSNAANCIATADPGGQYESLIERADLESRTLPLYRFYSADRTNSYYTTDKETLKSVEGEGFGYSLVTDVDQDGTIDNQEGIVCRVLANRGEDGGVSWIKEYWHNNGNDHRYTTALYDKGESDDYKFVRTLDGYVYENNGTNGADDQYLQPLLLYFNKETKDHLITIDPQREAFGSPDGGDGYEFVTTLGFAIPHNF